MIGVHLISDLYGCSYKTLDDIDHIKRSLITAAVEGGATIIHSNFHRFAPQGVSGTITIAESSITIHTWPEHGFAAIDVFTCGHKVDTSYIMDLIEKSLPHSLCDRKSVARGEKIVENTCAL